MTFKYRPHRGSLAAAMEEVREFDQPAELFAFLRQEFDLPNCDADFDIKPYGFDKRIGWDTHIITIAGFGVVGFTDGMPEGLSPHDL